MGESNSTNSAPARSGLSTAAGFVHAPKPARIDFGAAVFCVCEPHRGAVGGLASAGVRRGKNLETSGCLARIVETLDEPEDSNARSACVLKR